MKRVLDTIAGWVQSFDERRDEDAVLLDVRRLIQPDGHSCGAQSALMILRCHGKGRSIKATIRALATDEEGTSTGALLKLFRRRGLKPVIKSRAKIADLRRGIVAGAPSIVSLDDERHWGVVFGFAGRTGEQRIYLADPSLWHGLRVGLSVRAFRERWDRYAIVVHKR